MRGAAVQFCIQCFFAIFSGFPPHFSRFHAPLHLSAGQKVQKAFVHIVRAAYIYGRRRKAAGSEWRHVTILSVLNFKFALTGDDIVSPGDVRRGIDNFAMGTLERQPLYHFIQLRLHLNVD